MVLWAPKGLGLAIRPETGIYEASTDYGSMRSTESNLETILNNIGFGSGSIIWQFMKIAGEHDEQKIL